MLNNEGKKLRKAVVSSPGQSYFHVDSLEEHNMLELANPALTRIQHDTLKAVLAGSGCSVMDLPELEGHPNSVFTRDTAVTTHSGFIEMRMGLPSRRGEEKWMSEALISLGLARAGVIEDPGTAEGGDIILAGEVAFVGISGRTNREGSEQVRELLSGMGYEVRTARVPSPYLHLGGAMSMIGRRTLLCAGGIFDNDLFRGYETIGVSFPSSGLSFARANVICLGELDVLSCRSSTTVNRTLLEKGVNIHTVDLSEFIKGSGGPTCLVMPVDRG